MTHFCCAAVLPSLRSEGGDPAGRLSSTPHGPEPCCSGQGSPPSLRGTSLGLYTTLLKSILQQPGLRVCKQSRELRGTAATEKDLATTQELYFSTFLSLAYRKGTSISPVFNRNDSSSTFQGHTNHCIAGRYKRGHVPGLNVCTGVSCSLMYVVLRLLPAIQETARVTAAAFLLGLVQMQSTAYQRSLWSCADVKHFFPLPFTAAGFNNRHLTLPACAPAPALPLHLPGLQLLEWPLRGSKAVL